jgi:hypothetical protein
MNYEFKWSLHPEDDIVEEEIASNSLGKYGAKTTHLGFDDYDPQDLSKWFNITYPNIINYLKYICKW